MTEQPTPETPDINPKATLIGVSIIEGVRVEQHTKWFVINGVKISLEGGAKIAEFLGWAGVR